MAGTSYLPLVVEVAFGADPLDTGTLTWTDISAHVKRGTGLDFSRGWDTESGEPLSGRLTLTVNNDDGDFTPGATGVYGLIRNRLPIRVSAVVSTGTGNPLTYDDDLGWYDMDGVTYDAEEIGTAVLWTGLVESWRIMWENGVRSQVALTCVDRWAAIRRLKFDGKFIERVVANQAPTHFWPATDVAGSARLVDTVAGLDVTEAITCAAAANPQTWLTLPVATTTSTTTVTHPTSWTPSGAGPFGFTLAGWVHSSASNLLRLDFRSSSLGPGLSNDYLQMRSSAAAIPDTQFLWMRSGVPGTGISDATDVSGWRHLVVTVDVNSVGWVEARFYAQGVLLGTDTLSGGWPDMNTLTIHAEQGLAYVGLWDRALTGAQILEQYRAGTTMGVAGETADVRAQRLLTLVSPAPSLTDVGTFTSTMSKQSLVDKSLGEALMECAAAEAGALHIGTDGWPVLTSRSWRTGNAAAFTIPAHALSADVSWTLDDQQLCNSASVDRMVEDTSAGTVKTRDESSVTTYGEQNRSLSLWLHTDAQALDRANAESHMFATPLPRSADLSVDVLTKAATIPAATMLAANIGDRIEVSGMPAEAPGETEFYIDSITDRVSASEWQRTFTVSPRRDFWTLQDATFGVIDSVYVLAY